MLETLIPGGGAGSVATASEGGVKAQRSAESIIMNAVYFSYYTTGAPLP
jgi:hypothetical protein